jgi:hypothetical protein
VARVEGVRSLDDPSKRLSQETQRTNWRRISSKNCRRHYLRLLEAVSKQLGVIPIDEIEMLLFSLAEELAHKAYEPLLNPKFGKKEGSTMRGCFVARVKHQLFDFDRRDERAGARRHVGEELEFGTKCDIKYGMGKGDRVLHNFRPGIQQAHST